MPTTVTGVPPLGGPFTTGTTTWACVEAAVGLGVGEGDGAGVGDGEGAREGLDEAAVGLGVGEGDGPGVKAGDREEVKEGGCPLASELKAADWSK